VSGCPAKIGDGRAFGKISDYNFLDGVKRRLEKL
jgi:hypothetical protein